MSESEGSSSSWPGLARHDSQATEFGQNENCCSGSPRLPVKPKPDTIAADGSSENDIHAHVTRRKISAGTRSDLGRDCRDIFLALAKTRARQGLAFLDCLGSRFRVTGCAVVPPLDDYVRR